ncbi:UDP-glucose/GDP-mannose dehydrogenase family protein [Candidatus Peregrinibacteria bacterium]|nr:UDP-glucose/GDP-mannose dehydrogenase family protein [Candidatus Peregrinibacteria bacterium]
MHITVIGTGYVGLVSAVCFAEMGYEVMGIDICDKKIAQLNNGEVPIYEPGLEDLIKKNKSRLKFTTNIQKGIEFGDIIFSAVGTPPDKDHKADLSAVKAVAKSFGESTNGYKIFVNKSTVPVGTGEICKKIIQNEVDRRGVNAEFDIVSNPEFLREGAAIKDTLNPDRIVVGTESKRAEEFMIKLYRPITRTGSPVVNTNIKTAEMIKYAANSFLATKISFINEIANFCEKTGADVTQVARGIGLDKRIGSRFLHAGIGYGGSCFPKDVRALIQKGKEFSFDFKILQAVVDVNDRQKERIFEKLHSHIPNLEGKTIAVWGLAFKPRTDDMRDAPSIRIVKRMQAEGAKVKAFDPVSMKVAKGSFANVNLVYTKNAMDAAKDADALLVLTEWDEFRTVDLNELNRVMRGNYLFDGRNIFEPEEAISAGFNYVGIGRAVKRVESSSNIKVKINKPAVEEVIRIKK